MKRLRSDLLPALLAVCDGRLGEISLDWRDEAALCVVVAAAGYPGDVVKGGAISGLDAAGAVPGATVFHAATERNAAGQVVATGGRVLGVTATGATVGAAQRSAYRAVDAVEWPGGFCRRDIGWRAV
jgi:phosphoribosylamine--glycine ligase